MSDDSNLHWNTMDAKTRQTFSVLASLPVPDEFYLAGGTALALQIGHRTSLDLDFSVHLAYALSYFDDAETDQHQLNMIEDVDWEDVKAYCLEGARLLSKLNAGLEPPSIFTI